MTERERIEKAVERAKKGLLNANANNRSDALVGCVDLRTLIAAAEAKDKDAGRQLSDADIVAIRRGMPGYSGPHPWSDSIAFARAVIAAMQEPSK